MGITNETLQPLRHFVDEMLQRAENGWRVEQAVGGDAIDQALAFAWNWAGCKFLGPVPRPPKSEPTQTESITTDPKEARTSRVRTMQWLHGIAQARDLQHAELSNLLCWGCQAASMKDLPIEFLNLAGKFVSALSMEDLVEKWGELQKPEKKRLEPLKNYLKAWFERGNRVVQDAPVCPLESDLCEGSHCGEFILWGITENQKRVPLNLPEIRELSGEGKPEKRYIEKIILNRDGTTVLRVALVDTWPDRGKAEGGVRAYMPHHATCPDVQRFRKGKGP